MFPSLTKREIRHLNVVVDVQWRQRNVQQKAWCFATINLLLFGLSSCRRRPLGSLLKSLSNDDGDGNLNVIKASVCVFVTLLIHFLPSLHYYAVHSLFGRNFLISGVLWRTLAQDDDILRFFLWSWSGGGIVLKNTTPTNLSKIWNIEVK